MDEGSKTGGSPKLFMPDRPAPDFNYDSWGDVTLLLSKAGAAAADTVPSSQIPEDTTIRVLISSKVLAEKSPVFKLMLTNGSMAESRALAACAHVEIPLPDEDPDTFLLVLDAMYGCSPESSHGNCLEQLLPLALAVDRWQCPAEPLQGFVRDGVRRHAPTAWCRDVVPWLWIAMVHSLEKEASALASIAILEITGPIDLERDNEHGVPLSPRVVGTSCHPSPFPSNGNLVWQQTC